VLCFLRYTSNCKQPFAASIATMSDYDFASNKYGGGENDRTDYGSLLNTSTASMTFVNVVAPATLPEGYQFDTVVEHDDSRTIKVTVPLGGVEKGQPFSVPLIEASEVQTVTIATKTTSPGEFSILEGHWRDSIFGCFNYGLCHPHCWTSYCCPLSKCILCPTSLFSVVFKPMLNFP
jgi:hypothetical protein